MKKNISFLLIDDDEDDRELFQMALENVDAEIQFTEASCGQSALSLLEKATSLPDIIFLDLNMPRMSGRECLTELKNHPTLSTIPVVIFSTSSDPRDKKELMESGAVDFITKPSKTSELTRLLEDFIIQQLHI